MGLPYKPSYGVFSFTHDTQLLLQLCCVVDSTSMTVPSTVGAIREVQTINLQILVERFSKSDCFLPTLSHLAAFKFSQTTTIIDHRKYSQLHPCIVVNWASKSGCACGCHKCTLSLKHIPKESEVQPLTTVSTEETVVVCNRPASNIESVLMIHTLQVQG